MKTAKLVVLGSLSLFLSGCATLAVTPPKQAQSAAKKGAKIGIQVRGERLQDALRDKEYSAIAATSGKLFESVSVLPAESLTKEPKAVGASHGVDFVVTTTISDVNVSGNLNPLWFATIPLLVFKPFAPIVTFEAIVTLDHAAYDARTGAEVFRRQISETATDHYSPINPQDKVRALVGRAINNDFTAMLEELHGKVTP